MNSYFQVSAEVSTLLSFIYFLKNILVVFWCSWASVMCAILFITMLCVGIVRERERKKINKIVECWVRCSHTTTKHNTFGYFLLYCNCFIHGHITDNGKRMCVEGKNAEIFGIKKNNESACLRCLDDWCDAFNFSEHTRRVSWWLSITKECTEWITVMIIIYNVG